MQGDPRARLPALAPPFELPESVRSAVLDGVPRLDAYRERPERAPLGAPTELPQHRELVARQIGGQPEVAAASGTARSAPRRKAVIS
jgi:hypothetical protein